MILSGRSDVTHQATRDWLNKHGVWFDTLTMRTKHYHYTKDSDETLECYSFGNETDPKFYSYRPNIENEDRDANLKALNKKKEAFKAKTKEKF